MMAITIRVAGDPVAKERPRIGKGGNIYTPRKTHVYEAGVGWKAKQAMQGASPFECPVELTAVCIIEPPQSWAQIKREAAISGLLLPVSAADVDNYLKAICDGLNKIVFKDDKQVCRATVAKMYGPIAETIITVTPILANVARAA